MEIPVVSVSTYVLKLTGEEAYLGALPSGAVAGRYFVRPPWRSLYSSAFETLLVRIEAADGCVGWGESLAPVGPEVPAAVVSRLLAPALTGADSRQLHPLLSRLAGLMRERGHLVGHQADALAACDIALHDLVARRAGLPVAELLGGVFRTTIPTYVSGLPRPSDDERSALASSYVEQGVRRVKLALGAGVGADLATFDAVAAAGPLEVAVDAHWAYDRASALRLGRGLDERGAWFLEAPLVPEDGEGHRQLAAWLDTPVAVGETLRNRYEFSDWIDGRRADLLQPDVGRTGLREATAAACLAAAHHLLVAPHHSVGLGVSLAAGLQLAAAAENLLAFEFQPTTIELANSILRTPIAGGPVAFELPSGPGLGVEVDEDYVAGKAEAPS